jgi:hypothetical protein
MLKSSKRLAVSWGIAALLGAAGLAHADYAPFQGYVEMPQTLAPMIMGNLASENLRLINEQNARGGGKTAPPAAVKRAATTAPPPASTSTPRALAARYPADQRARIERAFSESLRSYQQIEARFGIPGNDVAGALAAFVAGSYMAYRDVDFPDQYFPVLVAQMRNVLSNNPAFQHASAAEKRDVYEQTAIIGTFMAATRETLKRQPPDATVARNFRASARANLEQFLKTDADRVTVGEQGLVIR